MNAAGRPLPRQARERLAACESVGLHYWADAPVKGCVWAVDESQRAHTVRIDRDTGTARHICCDPGEKEDHSQHEEVVPDNSTQSA